MPSNSPQPTYSIGGVQATDDVSDRTLEPHRIYQLADGRLVMSRECNAAD